ncbi:MAG: TPM domain-containing protein [Bacteroidota bacterium]|nr:TPM domain-containing protein [Bacteroidota bacterium]
MQPIKKIIFFLFLLPLVGWSQSFPDKPLNYVTDEAEALSIEEEELLNHKLHLFQDSTSSQIFVYIAPSLNGQDLSTIGQEIFVKWDIGQKGKNNGVLIAIFINDHKFRIHTGYGMEGVLPDLLTKKIQDEEMRPSFKKNNYYEGINKGVDKIIYYNKNEYKPEVEDPFWGFVLLYVAAAIVYALLCIVLHFGFKQNKGLRITLFIVGGVFLLIPFVGLIVLGLMLVVMGILVIVIRVSKNIGSGNYRSGNNSDNNNFWSSSSSSDSSYSSSSDSDSSFSGGGGGDSGGGGSNSDW